VTPWKIGAGADTNDHVWWLDRPSRTNNIRGSPQSEHQLWPVRNRERRGCQCGLHSDYNKAAPKGVPSSSLPVTACGRLSIAWRKATQGMRSTLSLPTPYNVAVAAPIQRHLLRYQCHLLELQQHFRLGSAISTFREIHWNDSCAGAILSALTWASATRLN